MLNPFVDIFVGWIRREAPHAFGPKEVGPPGFAEPRYDVLGELGELGTWALGGGLLSRLRRDEQLAPSAAATFGFPTVPRSRVAELIQRMRQARAQVKSGSPLPAQPAAFRASMPSSASLLGGTGGSFTQRSARIRGTPLAPVSTGVVFR